jgi:hypothetical protein
MKIVFSKGILQNGEIFETPLVQRCNSTSAGLGLLEVNWIVHAKVSEPVSALSCYMIWTV